MQAKLKCAIYTRVSTDNQLEVEFNSCEAQEAKIKSFIDSQENMSIFKVYSDPGFTGTNLNRPALQEMLNDIKRQKINLVISYNVIFSHLFHYIYVPHRLQNLAIPSLP